MKSDKFDDYKLKYDQFSTDVPQIKLDDLSDRYSDKIKLSIMMSTYNRGGQLTRALETLCRQCFVSFEVLINDDGSTQDIKGIVDTFSPYLNIQYFFTPRHKWVSCPSKAFKMMLEYCKGDVIAVTHPEMMFQKSATYYLYWGVFNDFDSDTIMYAHLDSFNIEKPKRDDWIWVTFKPLFIDKNIYSLMDSVDWHSDVDNLRNISGFPNAIGLSNKPNLFHLKNIRFPWWFVGSAKRECPIWDDLEVFRGHAAIDMWLLTYRHYNKIVDCNPFPFLCYHQAHAVTAFGPDNDNDAYLFKDRRVENED